MQTMSSVLSVCGRPQAFAMPLIDVDDLLLPQGMLLKDVEPAMVLRYMAFFATLILLVATAVLERDVLWRLPPLSSTQFYATLLLNCSLAIASNFLNMLVTKASGPLSLQVRRHAHCSSIMQTTVLVLWVCRHAHWQLTSTIVMQVFGNLFGVLSTVFSIAVFRNPVSLAGMCGYALSIVGVLLYSREKHSESSASTPQPKAHGSDSGMDGV